MADELKRYRSDEIDVTYNTARCLHVAECLRGLPDVFDTSKRPWVKPNQAGPDEVAEVVRLCPTGALHFIRKDGGAAEPVPTRNIVHVAADGPLYLHGDLTIKTISGEILLQDTRVALCRCGQTGNPPFCDNSHLRSGFSDPGRISAGGQTQREAHRPLQVILSRNGPYLLEGDFEIISDDGRSSFCDEQADLCRCGGSQDKPFCDGTHRKIGFRTTVP